MGKKKKVRKEERPFALADEDVLLSMDDLDFDQLLKDYPEATGEKFVAIAKMVKLLESK